MKHAHTQFMHAHGVQAGVDYAFWSAFTVMEEQARIRHEASQLGVDPAALKVVLAQRDAEMQARAAQRAEQDPRIHVLDEHELLEYLESKAREAIAVGGLDVMCASACAHERVCMRLCGLWWA